MTDKFPPRVFIHAPGASFGHDMAMHLVAYLNKVGGTETEYLSKTEHEAILRDAVAELIESSEQLVYGSHGTAFLPGQMDRWKKVIEKYKALEKLPKELP